jgi:putative membrane-bound dehydrogenase-like protein
VLISADPAAQVAGFADKTPSEREPALRDDEASLAARLPRIPPVEAHEALKTFRLAGGFQLEVVACEPDVADPVDACFDANGRMYVAEMHGYPFSQEPTKLNPRGGGKRDAGIIRLLEDTNGDGRMDQSDVFADGLSWPTSVCCYRGGLFVIAPPHILYLKDTDGDLVADVRDVIYSGFNRDNVQGLANNLKWGLDNRIYAAAGRNGGVITHRGEELFAPGRRDIGFDPSTEVLELVSGGAQFGHSLDNWGNRFVCSNSNHIQHVLFPERYLVRNRYLAVPNVIRSIAGDGAAAQVFRASPPEPWRIIRQQWRAAKAGFELVQDEDGSWRFVARDAKQGARPPEYPVGFFTSASGVTIYRGAAYPLEFSGNAFVGDVGGNLVHRKRLEPHGASFSAARADQGAEVVASTDNWFRPVNFVNAPDGTLYILDMYRETIEHPHSVPLEIKRHLDLESGDDRGRIYRLVAPGMKRIPLRKLAALSTEQLVAELDSPNGWSRQTAQRLLWEQQDSAAVPLLERLVASSWLPLARLHALWTLDGLGALSPKLLTQALTDAHAGVREHAVLLSEKHLDSAAGLIDALDKLADDPAYRVRFQLALSLGESDGPQSTPVLAQLARSGIADVDFRTALLTSVAGRADTLADDLLDDQEFLRQAGARPFLAELARTVGANAEAVGSLRLLARGTEPDRPADLKQLVLQSLGEGLARRGASLNTLLADDSSKSSKPPVSEADRSMLREVRRRVDEMFRDALKVAADQDRPIAVRLPAVGLLGYDDDDETAERLQELLAPQIPQLLQLAAVAALSNGGRDRLGERLIAGWSGYSPQVRRRVVDALLRSVPLMDGLLDALAARRIQPAEIDLDAKQILTNYPNPTIRDRSRKLFGRSSTENRAQVVADYQQALDLESDPRRGRTIFEKNCSICHRVGDAGHAVGPDLASTKNKSAADLIVAILDPSREAQSNYTAYTLLTRQGKVLNGMIAAETATSLTLLRAEGKQDLVLRANIDTMASNGKSLMPEGVEKEITPQQMADLIAFVQGIKPPNKK